MCAWPSHSETFRRSLVAWRTVNAQVCLRTCGDTRLAAREGHDNGDLSSGGSEHPGGFLSGNTSKPDPPSAQIDGVFGPRKTTRLCGVALSTRLLDLLGWIGDRLSLGPSVYIRIYNAFGSKSDKVDARKLADWLRTGMLRAVYHGENGLRTLRELGRVIRRSAKI
jgi:hypothetical protein